MGTDFSHPLLVPPDFVHTVVVTSDRRHSSLVEVWVEEQSPERVLPTGRCAVEADPRDVVIRILRRHCLVPEDAVREAGVAEVLPRHVVEGLRAVVRTHTVDLHDDEPDLRLRLHGVEGAKGLGDEGTLRPGVDVLDDWVLFRGIEVGRSIDDAPDVGLSVATLRDEDLWRLPARGL